MFTGKVNIFGVGGCIPHEVAVDSAKMRGPFGLPFPMGQDLLVPQDKRTEIPYPWKPLICTVTESADSGFISDNSTT